MKKTGEITFPVFFICREDRVCRRVATKPNSRYPDAINRPSLTNMGK
jgi:hypothetical protein